jgi:membrane associated rhomboid family serine protease
VIAAVAGRLRSFPWATLALGLVCVALFVATGFEADPHSPAAHERWGWRSATDIRGGDYWALFTSNLLHSSAAHLAINLVWLSLLGSAVERSFGPWRWLVFVPIAAVISAGIELQLADEVGVGISGVVFAAFGLLLMSPRQRCYLAGRPFTAITVIFACWLGFDVWRFASRWIAHEHLRGIPSTAHIAGFLVGVATGLAARRFTGAGASAIRRQTSAPSPHPGRRGR